ncbi:MAG: hypothetical protein AAFR23_01715 [Pseudomonadota bacterium]
MARAMRDALAIAALSSSKGHVGLRHAVPAVIMADRRVNVT